MKITIPETFCGPPNSGNGGYVSGILDKHTNYLSEVTLKKPIPLEKEMHLEIQDDMHRLLDGEEVIAYSRPGTWDLEVPESPTFDEAILASKGYAGLDGKHAFPGCFVCGPDHQDGMYIFAGKVGKTHIYASPWIPDVSLADPYNEIKKEFVWAALDCPGSFAIVGEVSVPIVLGRMTSKFFAPVQAKEPHVVIGWKLEDQGRKNYCGTAVFNEKKELCAAAKAIWFKI